MLIKKVTNPTLNFYYSTMGSGKSTALLQMNFSLKQAGFFPLLIKPKLDTRSLGTIKSRIGLEEPCTLLDGNEFNLDITQYSHILMDEAQFLTKDQVLLLQKTVDNFGKDVSCFGLRTSYKGELFEGSAVLFALSDNLYELPLIYSDGKKTIMHLRYVNNVPIFEGDPIHVGDIKEDYESVSRKRYFLVKDYYIK